MFVCCMQPNYLLYSDAIMQIYICSDNTASACLIILRMLVCPNEQITILEIYLKRVFDACLKRVPCQHNKIGTTCFRPVLCKCSHEVSMICIITCIFFVYEP